MTRYKSFSIFSFISCLFVGLVTSCSSRQADFCAERIAIQKMSGFPKEESGFSLGVSACYAGIVNGQLILAGGCNFPSIPASEGGKKRFYQGVYAADASVDSVFTWRKVGELPVSAAYGASITTPEGLICVGGANENGPLTTVYRLILTTDNQSIRIDTLPSLPFAMDNLGGAMVGNSLYVAGGNVAGKPSNVVLSLDLENLESGWQKQADFPGPARVQPVCAGQQQNEGEPIFYLWGGFAGTYDGRPASLSVDGYSYSPVTKQWLAVSTPVGKDSVEVSLGGGVGIAFADSLIVCTGGVNKDIFLSALQREERMKQAVAANDQSTVDSLKAVAKEYMLWPSEDYRFNDRLLIYNTHLNTWNEVIRCPEFARAGAALVRWENTLFVINGELKPGIRTPEITKITIE